MNENSPISENAKAVILEREWLKKILSARIKGEELYFSHLTPPELPSTSAYSLFIEKNNLSPADRLLLICALTPALAPEFFTTQLRDEKSSLKVKNSELGGYFDHTFTTFVPTVQTVIHLLAGEDDTSAAFYHLFLTEQSKLVRDQVVSLSVVNPNNPDYNEINLSVKIAPEYVRSLLSGKVPRPDFGKTFPASLIETDLDWDQLIVSEQVKKELERIKTWFTHGAELLNRTKKVNKSFPCLFYGPSGSGKTLAAQLIGKSIGADVFKIDLSMVVSKYVGETEKNLAFLFDRARDKNWILFFDEADSLFGKRSEIKDSKDKWANLEMSYLLQRMEEHKGLTILATNFRNNIDGAMTRRFQSVIYFRRPAKEERRKLWDTLLPETFSYNPATDFDKLSSFELTGANIMNVITAACLEAVCKNSSVLDNQEISEAIMREYTKENRTL